jgi:hypothetical protein
MEEKCLIFILINDATTVVLAIRVSSVLNCCTRSSVIALTANVANTAPQSSSSIVIILTAIVVCMAARVVIDDGFDIYIITAWPTPSSL